MKTKTETLNLIEYEGKLYIRATPVKALFKSNLVHDVVTRGDVFAVSLETGLLTVLKGTAEVTHVKAAFQVQREMF